MITLRVNRRWKLSTYTISEFYVDGKRWCETLEDRDRDLFNAMPVAEISRKKVYGETAIPRGQYVVELSYSPKFASKEWGKKYKGLVPEVKNVKGFSGVRMHPGSTAKDTLGCVLLGENKVKGGIINSKKWYYKLMDEVLVPAYEKGERVVLEIV